MSGCLYALLAFLMIPLYKCLGGEALLAYVAVLVAVFEPRFHNWLMRPELEILPDIKYRDFDPGCVPYKACRILIKNRGESAAQNCKGYIVTAKSKERVCWTVSAERPNATINKGDTEELDFCAFVRLRPLYPMNVVKAMSDICRDAYKLKDEEIPDAIRSTENGWPQSPKEVKNWTAKLAESQVIECEVLITASNAKPVSKKIKINYDKDTIEFIS